MQDLRLDHLRAARTGLPEVVFGEGKTSGQCLRALRGLLERDVRPAIATRVEAPVARDLLQEIPTATYDPIGRVVVAGRRQPETSGRHVAVVCAGTTDLPVARECSTVLAAFGIAQEIIADVGVAGLHRVVGEVPKLIRADVVVVIAGMEGALPTVVASLAPGPIIAVPTSVGYGAAFDGLAALLSMLNSCSPGITVVNIDSGLGAAMAVMRHLHAYR